MNLALYCDVNEAAGIAGITPKYVRVLLARGTLRGQKIGGRWVVLREDASNFARIPNMGRPPALPPPATTPPAPGRRKRRRK